MNLKELITEIEKHMHKHGYYWCISEGAWERIKKKVKAGVA